MPLEPATPPTTTTTTIITTPTPDPPTTSLTTHLPPPTINTTITSPPPPPSPPSQLPTRPIALSLLIACPILILAPPRKLDFYTFSLASAWAVSARHLYTTTSSTSFTSPFSSLSSPLANPPTTAPPHTKVGAIIKEEEREEADEGGVKRMARRLWMGDEKPGWEKRRLEEERERLGEGYGIGDLIRERVGEVFGGEHDGEEEEENEGSGEEKERRRN